MRIGPIERGRRFVSDRPARRRGRADGPALGICGGSLVVAVGALLPWYIANLREVFQPQSASGFSSGTLPKVAFAFAIIVALTGGVLVADARGLMPLDRGLASILASVCVVCAGLVAAIVCTRLITAPPEFNSRRYGLYLSAAGSVVALVSAIRHVVRR